MSISKVASAIPLVLGIACSTTGSQSSEHTGAMWPEKQGMTMNAGDTGGSGGPSRPSQEPSQASQDPSKEGTGAGASSAGASETGSDASGTIIATASGAPGSSETGSSAGSGGAMGSGGSSETTGSATPPAPAGDTGAPGSASAPGTMDQGSQTVQGKVSKISSKEVSITPKSGEAKTLKIGDQTHVVINGKDAKPSQLKQGQMVRASYANKDGEDVAMKIEVAKSQKKAHSGQSKSGSTGSGSTTETH